MESLFSIYKKRCQQIHFCQQHLNFKFSFILSYFPQHFLYFLPLPHVQWHLVLSLFIVLFVFIVFLYQVSSVFIIFIVLYVLIVFLYCGLFVEIFHINSLISYFNIFYLYNYLSSIFLVSTSNLSKSETYFLSCMILYLSYSVNAFSFAISWEILPFPSNIS